MEHYETFSCDRDRSLGMEVNKEFMKLTSVNFNQAYSQEFYFYVVCNAWVYKERVWEQRGKREEFGFGAIILSPKSRTLNIHINS